MKLALGVLIGVLAGCSEPSASPLAPKKNAVVVATPAVKPAAQAAPKDRSQWNVVDVALSSKDHTTLVTALQAVDLVESLSSPGGVYTIFAPTNAAFEKLPAGTVEGLLKPEKKTDLTAILKHHAAVPILQTSNMKDGQTLSMADGTTVTFHVKDGKVLVNDATILASIPATNGIVHVIDTVLTPGSK